MGGCRRDEPAQRAQLPDGVCRPACQEGAVCDARQGCLGLGGICCGIAAAQRASQSDSPCGHRHERGLHQGGGQQPGERSGGVRQIPRHPECGGGVRPGPEGGESV